MGQRSGARGGVVVIASDGWERGDAALPHLDDLVAGHSLNVLHTLADVIARA